MPHETTDRETQVSQGFAVETNGLRLLRDIANVNEWRAIGLFLARRVSSTNWALGDWLLAHRGEWGDMYTNAQSITGLSYDSLVDIAATARAWPRNERDAEVSWSMHRVGKTAARPKEILSRAKREKWSVQRLQSYITAVNAERRTPEEQEKFVRSRGGRESTHVMCPKCEHTFMIHGNRVATPPKSAERKSRSNSQLHIVQSR